MGTSGTNGVRRAALVVAGALIVVGAGYARAADLLLAGKKLVLSNQALKVVSQDPAIGIGGGAGSADDPTLNGGSLRVLSIEGDVFDTTYPLPAAGWRALTRKGATIGFAFKGTDVVRAVVVKSGKVLRVRARGAVGHTLGEDPDPVRVVLTLGAQQSCLNFGGTVALKPGARFTASDAAAPTICPLPYGADDRMWACRPDLPADICHTSNQDWHELLPDGSSADGAFVDDPSPKPYDCFYVYPTVDIAGPPGNHLDVTDAQYVSYVADPVVAQAARFRNQCRIFAPHYRQVTFGAQVQNDPNLPTYATIAFNDVLDAWRLYLKYQNGGRNVVIMGHSQGTAVLTRLMQQEVDPSPALRAKLITALLIGGGVNVPFGEVVGGSFVNVPLCTAAAETGCVIAYRSYAEGFAPVGGSNSGPGPTRDTACTNPAALGGGEEHFAGVYLPTHANQALFQIVPGLPLYPPFVLYEDFYAGECVPDSTGHHYLEIRVRPDPGDVRVNQIPFTSPILSPALLGTHIIDYQWAMGDLLSLVATKAAAMP